MFDFLNPCNDPNAWWQQLLMLAGPFLLGLLWPKGSVTAEVDESLTARLSGLDADLADCNRKSLDLDGKIKAAAANTSVNAPSVAASAVAGAASLAGATSTKKSKKDDLKVVEGIGPKIEELFNNAGIYSFEELANTSADKLKEILVAAGSRFQMHDPTTWPAQSKLADEGKWEELKKWQDELNAGQK